MATTAARMQQRRRTAAQWASENPVLASGEVGYESDGSNVQMVKVGDGTSTWVALKYIQPVDFYRLPASCAFLTGTATQVTSNSWTGVNLPATGTSGICHVQSFPAYWTTASLSWGFVPLTGNAGNIRWSVNIRRVNALGFGDLISDAPQTTDTFTAAGGTVSLQMEHVFNHPTSFAVHNGDAVVGEVVNVTVDRLGDDGADTHTSAVLLTNYSFNWVT